MGLENMVLFNQKLGNPANKIKTIHVTGTNGKGSVVFKIAKALEASGYKTGMYVSPHISSFRERITINGEMIPEEEVVRNLEKINEIEKTLPNSLTFFESVTGMAFNYFCEKDVDIAVIEVGLGGRLDSTNIINPEMSVIASIGLDHRYCAREGRHHQGRKARHRGSQLSSPAGRTAWWRSCVDLQHCWQQPLAVRARDGERLRAPVLR